MRWLALLVIALTPLRAELIDKLAIAVDHKVITELGIDEDLRVVALINGLPVDRSLDYRRAAADRLVQRLLIQHEMEISRYPLPTEQEVAIYLAQVENTLGGPTKVPDALRAYNLTENTLVNYLTAQLTMLRFIDYRFTPDVSVSDADIEAAYQREVTDLHRQHPDAEPPPLNDLARGALTQKLTEVRTDAALETWLAESRKQVTIVYLDTALQ